MQEKLYRALKIDHVRWALLVGADGQRFAVGQIPDALAQGTLAAMILAVRETLGELEMGALADLWLTTDRLALVVTASTTWVLVLGADAARANVGLVRMHARKLVGQLSEGNNA